MRYNYHLMISLLNTFKLFISPCAIKLGKRNDNSIHSLQSTILKIIRNKLIIMRTEEEQNERHEC